MYESACKSEHEPNEGSQRHNAAVRGTPERLTFADQGDRFVAGEGLAHRPNGSEMLANFDPPFDGPMVLRHHILKVRAHPMPAGFGQSPFGFELCDGGWVGTVTIGVDHPRCGVILPAQSGGQSGHEP
jgi:hypothetical protein